MRLGNCTISVNFRRRCVCSRAIHCASYIFLNQDLQDYRITKIMSLIPQYSLTKNNRFPLKGDTYPQTPILEILKSWKSWFRQQVIQTHKNHQIDTYGAVRKPHLPCFGYLLLLKRTQKGRFSFLCTFCFSGLCPYGFGFIGVYDTF